jgi:hypothetical protein
MAFAIDSISGLIANKVSMTPIARNPVIALVASKEFLNSYLIYKTPGLKEMLWGKALEDVMDKF